MIIEWTSPMWQDRVRIALGYPRNGWVLLAIMTAAFNQHVVIHCSDVFCPFQDIHSWLSKIHAEDLPAQVAIHEEGHWKTLLATRYELDEDAIEFYIFDSPLANVAEDRPDDPLLRCRTNRLQFVKDVAEELQRWIRDDSSPKDYGGRSFDDKDGDFEAHEYYLRRIDLGSLFKNAA